MSTSIRQRPSRSSPSEPYTKSEPGPADRHISSQEEDEEVPRSVSFADIIRILTTLLALFLSLSYYLTSGESLTFNYQPWFVHPGRTKAWIRGPITLTSQQLALYNGTDQNLPIYLSINRTLFDVSSSPHTYGPGGSYHIFAGRDATRAFVTGCFQTDLTGDLRGVEKMYIPVEDLAQGEQEDGDPFEGGVAGENLTLGEKKIRAEREKRQARKRVQKEVEKWIKFYADNAKYFPVGRLIDAQGEIGQEPELCESAERARPKRSQLIENAKAAAGKDGGQKLVFRPKKDDAPRKPV